MPDIHISGLTKQFGDTKVLKGLDLTVKDGEFLTLLGSSGCGKSTLLKLIAGLDQPDSGSIRLGERDLLALSPSQRDCAMVFQSYALYPHMTVGGNICTPLLMRGLNFWGRLPGAKFFSANTRQKNAEAKTSGFKVAQSLGIDGLWERKPAQLSGGQRQRVALARAMVRHPAVFLFDEPLSNLDANLRQALRTEIRQLHDQLGVTFIYVTHDQHEAMSMSDRVAVMREGRILQIGTPEEIYIQPENLDVARFVGAPRINLLHAEVRANGSVWAQGLPVGHSPGMSGPCHIAFRPQAGSLESVDGMMVQGIVVSVEYTGAELIASLQVDGSQETSVFCLSANNRAIRLGQPLRVSVPLDEIQLFDADGKRRAFKSLPVLIGEAA
jgi:multiple sugar transport system ATP-binding protein